MAPSEPPGAASALAGFRDVEYGLGAISRVPRIVEEREAERLFLVTGRDSFDASGAAAVLPELERVTDVIRWSDFRVNVDVADLVRGLELVQKIAPRMILGIGGGSVLDMAKLLAAFETTPADATVIKRVREGAPVAERRSQLLLVPTTSGSGSEATHFAVAYVGDVKFSVAGPALRADGAILDPCLSLSGSPHQRAISGMDAICQAIESTWAVGATTDSRKNAGAALRYLLRSIEAFVNRPSPAVAASMCVGSHLAGRAIDVSKTTGAHALSYALTTRYGISHGHAVALTLGAFVEAHADATSEDLQPCVDAAVHRRAMTEVLSALGADDGPGAKARLVRLLDAIGLESRLSPLGVDRADLRTLAEGVNAERLGNNPVRMTAGDLRSILHKSM